MSPLNIGATLTPLPSDDLPPVSMATHPNSFAYGAVDPSTAVLTPTGLLMVKNSSSANDRGSADQGLPRVHSPPDGASSLFSFVPQGGSTPSRAPVIHSSPHATKTATALNPQVRLNIEKLEMVSRNMHVHLFFSKILLISFRYGRHYTT